LVNRAFHTYQEMLAKGHEATSYSINILLDACARGNQPARGQEIFDKEIFDKEIPLHNIEISCTEWNSLLSVYKAAGDMVCDVQCARELESSPCMLHNCISVLHSV